MSDATGTSPEDWRTWRAFLAAHAVLVREVDSRLHKSHHLNQGEYGSLAAIFEAPGRRMRVGDVADRLGWEKSRVSHLVTRMEQRGLVARDVHPSDGRATDIVITPLGRRRLLSAVRQHAADLRELFFTRMTSEESDTLRAVFERMQQRGPSRS